MMSRMISIFCHTNVPLSAIRNSIEETLQITFSAREIEGIGVVFEGEYDGIVVSAFGDHGLEDDVGIEFTRYSIEIDISGGQSEVDLIESGLKVAKRISEQFRCTTIVVNNLQQLKATFHGLAGPP